MWKENEWADWTKKFLELFGICSIQILSYIVQHCNVWQRQFDVIFCLWPSIWRPVTRMWNNGNVTQIFVTSDCDQFVRSVIFMMILHRVEWQVFTPNQPELFGTAEFGQNSVAGLDGWLSITRILLNLTVFTSFIIFYLL